MKTCSIESCDNLVEGLTEYCASHNASIRKAERQSKKVQVVVPVKKISAKMAKELVDYGVMKRIYLQENPECEIQIPGVCTKIAVEVHHCAKRGVNLLKPDTFKSGCRECHDYVEFKMSAEERREKGLLITKTNQTV